MLAGRTFAGMVVLEQSGVSMLKLEYDDIKADPGVRWWCEGNWNGHRVFSTFFPYPAQAVEDLMASVINGGLCLRCKRRMVVGIATKDYCSWALSSTDLDDPNSYEWSRSCVPVA